MTDLPLTVDLAAWRVQVGEQKVSLTYQEFRALVVLVVRAGQVVPRSMLADLLRLEGGKASERSVDTYVARLRKKLGAAGWSWIETVRQVGYRCEVADPGSVRLLNAKGAPLVRGRFGGQERKARELQPTPLQEVSLKH